MFLTMSRGALFAISVMLIVFLRKLRMRWQILAPTIVLLAGLLLAPKLLFQRLEQSGTTGGAGRIYIWQTGMAALKDFGLIGAGLGNFPSVFDKYSSHADEFVGFRRDPHNIYLETMVELGIVGLGLLVLAVASQLRMAKLAQPSIKGIPANLRIIACQAAGWGMLTASFFLGTLWFKTFWLPWIMLTLACSERATERAAYPGHYPALESQMAKV